MIASFLGTVRSAGFSLVLLLASSAGGTTLVVSNTNDLLNGDTSSPDALLSSPGSDGISLREALTAANNAPGPHTITFAPALAGQSIALKSILPRITGDQITLAGLTTTTGQPNITIDGTWDTAGTRGTIHVVASSFKMTGLRFIYAPPHFASIVIGGAAYSSTGQLLLAPLRISGVRIEGNAFTHDGSGGDGNGIFVTTDLTEGSVISNVVIANNSFTQLFEGILAAAGAGNSLIEDLFIHGNRFSEHTADGTSAVEVGTTNTPGSNNGLSNRVRGTRIWQNTFTGNLQGIALVNTGRSGTLEDTLIAGNTFTGNQGAISPIVGGVGGTNNTISNTRIINNLMSLTGYGAQSGAVAVRIIDNDQQGTNNRVRDVAIINNTVNGNGPPGTGVWIDSTGGVSGVSVSNSIFWGSSADNFKGMAANQVQNSITTQSGFAGTNNNFNADPLFVNAGGGDFRLQAGSPAINAGTATAAPSLDLDCKQRVGLPDIGALEYGGTAAPCDPTTAVLNLVQGWNLVGNSVNSPIDVGTDLADASKIASVWKWVAANSRWAFFSPSLVGQALTDYANSKGYDVLTTINGGEGFWVNAKAGFTLQLPVATAIASTSLRSMASGWNLASIGDSKTPSGFNLDMGSSPPAAGVVPRNVNSLWLWDNAQSKWYFYAPALDAQGGTRLSDYISRRGYLDFASADKTFGPGIGFWVHRP